MTNTDCLIDFSSIDWTTPADGVRTKEVIRGGNRLRLIEFSEQFKEADWCKSAHAGYVVDGELTLEFVDVTVKFKSGDALFLPPGESTKHKAHVTNGKATLFVVEKA